MRRTTTCRCPAGTLSMTNFPSRSFAAPILVPATVTFAAGTPLPALSTTRPSTRPTPSASKRAPPTTPPNALGSLVAAFRCAMPAFIRIGGGPVAADWATIGASADFDALTSSTGCTDPNIFDVDGATFDDTAGGDAAIRRDSRLSSDFGASAAVGKPLSRTTDAATGELSVFTTVCNDTLLLRPAF